MTTLRADVSLPVRYSGIDDIMKRIPVSVVWEITLACDLACQHCGSRAGRRRRDELSTAEALDLVGQIAELGARSVGLIGGEAYLRKDWLQIIAAVRAAGMECDLQTGGRNLTAARAQAAADAGLNAVGISIDGIGATHDRLRGVIGSYELALAAMRNVRAAGLEVGVNSQINSATLHQLPELMDIIIAEGCRNWQLAITTAMGNAADHPDLLLQPWQMMEVMPLLAELAEKGRAQGLFLQPASNIGYFGPHESRLRNVMNEEIHFHGCNAGDTVLGIEADGTIKSCPGLPSPYAGGNIRERRLRDIWENAEPLAFNRRRTVDDLWGYCRGCYYAETCLAGCTWTAHALMGRAGNNPMCHHRALDFDARGLRERLVKVKDAEGRSFDHGEFEIVVERVPERVHG
ncbi:GDL motif peptide-associated radical SAM/SPASM maturase [Polymorphobacter glacialis]|uniref:GDL motif peptide-associated radical SAM/SPASM maturase n=1 Tax=Sandarakinorhabdus glacialis TaxID=1614636 RepID=A0A916ZU06_9SPHN|nr:radical SAM protein [Polymorphobacter glacialis]GGE12573.1 GDL motif peptide-associated radical SAM/SPASM maturase [Polymorphobacter glacialis]